MSGELTLDKKVTLGGKAAEGGSGGCSEREQHKQGTES